MNSNFNLFSNKKEKMGKEIEANENYNSEIYSSSTLDDIELEKIKEKYFLTNKKFSDMNLKQAKEMTTDFKQILTLIDCKRKEIINMCNK